MDIDYVKCYGNLQQELSEAKETLDSLNESIRRVVGRRQESCRNDRNKASYEPKKLERQNVRYGDSLKQKKRPNDAKSVFNRLSNIVGRSDDEVIKPRLNSRIIRELPTRQEIVDAQGMDVESRARNRRMFGSLLGTLHKFCLEESRLKQKEEKKAKIEKKVEQQEMQERENIRKKRELLFIDRKKKQFQIRSLEYKLSQLNDFKLWETAMMNYRYSIKTKSKPHIYFKPRKLCMRTEKLLTDSRTSLEKIIENKREALNKELNELDSTIQIDSIPDEEKLLSVSFLTKDKSPPQNISYSECKENNSRHLSDSLVCSSIFVVNVSEADPVN